jgi:hypothetical protein
MPTFEANQPQEDSNIKFIEDEEEIDEREIDPRIAG